MIQYDNTFNSRSIKIYSETCKIDSRILVPYYFIPIRDHGMPNHNVVITISNCVRHLFEANGKYQKHNRNMFSADLPRVTQFNPFKRECNAYSLKMFSICLVQFLCCIYISYIVNVYVNQMSHHWFNNRLSPAWLSAVEFSWQLIRQL